MIKTLAATALTAVMALTSIVPAQAFPVPALASPAHIEKAQWSNDAGRMIEPPRRDRFRSWNGHRGYHDYRPGYRRNNDGWWYPLAAFGLGAAIVGGMAAQQAPRPQVGVAMPVDHVRWCQSRYRSYDPYSDTFQPNRGPRQRCVSPY
ncbi:BA14K family protein [Pleomorphomonas sp. PLEO]|uniref:BA14K family protein n=1 Tax=Pleomorphomonas sp. PLEO TaxID=3239306 RepID=UPI00351E1476